MTWTAQARAAAVGKSARPVTVDGTTYPTRGAAIRALKCGFGTLYAMLQDGRAVEAKATTKASCEARLDPLLDRTHAALVARLWAERLAGRRYDGRGGR